MESNTRIRKKRKRRSKKKKILRIIGISLVSIAGLIIISGAVAYWKLTHINLDDIRQRHVIAADGSEPEATELPSVLNGALEKAESISGKSIKPGDAVDAASILLQSKLSIKEMYQLMSDSTKNLNDEKKQHTRDMLLAKLTPEEIEALRAITKNYGKGLVILDPNYPIELVGVSDPTERDKVKKKLEEREKSAIGSKATGDSSSTTSNNHPSSSPANPSSNTGTKTDLAGYEAELEKVRTGCMASASKIISGAQSQIKEILKNPGSSESQKAQLDLLGTLASAEASCDASFNSVINEAEQNHVEESVIKNWKNQFESAKSSVREQAIAKLK